MRKLFICWMAVLALCVAAACGAGAEGQEERLNVVATIFPPYDLARSIGEGGADVRMLIRPGVESHAYEPTPQDILAIGAADVFIYIGGENESWVDRVLDTMDTPNLRIVRLIDSVDPLEEDEGIGHDDDGGDDHGHGIDEHIWTAPPNAALMASAIERAMCEADPGRAQIYKDNGDALQKQLAALDADYRALVDGAVRKELVFGDRFPFIYLAREYGLECYAAFPSCSNDTEPSARTLAELIARVEADHIPVVYTIEQSNGRVASVIAEQTGAGIAQLHSCHNVTFAELESGATYLSLMRANLDALRLGLY